VAAITDALNDAWLAIRQQHPEVPQVTIAIAHRPWSRDGIHPPSCVIHWETEPVILADNDIIAQTPAQIMAWLLHLAAHGMAYKPGQKPPGRMGRYHSAAYRNAAERIGLDVKQDANLGYAETSMPRELAESYADQVKGIRAAKRKWEPIESSRQPGQNGVVLFCSCVDDRTGNRRRIRVWPWERSWRLADGSVIESGQPPQCQDCGTVYQP
jgi:hypothetical protein